MKHSVRSRVYTLLQNAELSSGEVIAQLPGVRKSAIYSAIYEIKKRCVIVVVNGKMKLVSTTNITTTIDVVAPVVDSTREDPAIADLIASVSRVAAQNTDMRNLLMNFKTQIENLLDGQHTGI